VSGAALRHNLGDDQWSPFFNSGNELAQSVVRPVQVSRPQLSAPSLANRSKWARATVDRLLALVPLKDNWDRRGSAAVRGDALSFAWTILAQVMPADGQTPVIVPLGNGGIQIEWSVPNVELEMEITRPFQISAFLYDRTNGEELEVPVDTENLDSLTQLLRQHFRT
jgi:hypothetical protein